MYGSPVKGASPVLVESDWTAAFRCLARADPISSDLQAVSREQARQLVLERYKGMGAMAPQCISSAGVLARDRSGVAGRGGGVLNGREKRAMTLSDAIFQGAFTDQGTNSEVDQLLPCSLGWSAVASKGLARKTSRVSKSKAVLMQREASMATSQENGSTESKHSTDEEYTTTESEQVLEDTVEGMDGDDNKGDVISTSESEGTASANKGMDMESPLVDEDLAGFAKVGSQKGKSSKKKKPTAELKTSPRLSERNNQAKHGKGAAVDAPQVLVYKTDANTRRKNHVTAQDREHTKQVLEGKSASQQNRVPAVKSKPTTKKATAWNDTSSKGSNVKNKQPTGTAPVPPPALDERTIDGMVGSPLGMRSMSSVGSSVHSSPSSVGQASHSSRSTSRNDRPEKETRSNMRPPPGLAPPPGFSSSGDANESLFQPSDSSEIGLPPMAPNLTPVEPPLSLGKSADITPLTQNGTETNRASSQSIFTSKRPSASSPVLTSQPSLKRTETQDSHGNNGGFDVMDFLDNIFGDEEPLEKKDERLGDLLADKPSEPIGGALLVSSDPWATERRSRAAAYGIHVESEDDDAKEDIVYAMLAPLSASQTSGDNSNSGLQNSVPLLTPSAMLAANQVDSDDGEEPSSAPLFSRGSFYSSLLQE